MTLSSEILVDKDFLPPLTILPIEPNSVGLVSARGMRGFDGLVMICSLERRRLSVGDFAVEMDEVSLAADGISARGDRP